MSRTSGTLNPSEDIYVLSRKLKDELCILDNHETAITYLELWDLLKRTNEFLRQKGLSENSTIITLLPNGLDQALLFLSSCLGGIRFAPLACTSTLVEVETTVNLLNPDLIILGSNLPFEKIQSISKLKCANEVLDIYNPLNWVTSIKEHHEFSHDAKGKLLIITSGSTGIGKVVQIDFCRLWNSAKNFSKLHECDFKSIIFWNYLPMSYLGGLYNLLLIPIAGGNSVYLDEAFDSKTLIKFWHTIEMKKISAIWLVPSIIRGLNQLSKSRNKFENSKIVRCFLGTAPIEKEEVIEFNRNFGIRPLQNYGLTETTFISSEFPSTIGDTSVINQTGNVGEILPGVKIKLKNLSTNNSKDEEIHYEIWVLSNYLMDGYLVSDKPGLQLDLDEEGYFDTGDIGIIRNKDLIITGRKKDIIKKGGLLINLQEIEHLANTSDGIVLSAAIKIFHKFYGESYFLAVEVTRNDSNYLENLRNDLQSKLSRHKWPEEIIAVDHLARTLSGKIKKADILRDISKQNLNFLAQQL